MLSDVLNVAIRIIVLVPCNQGIPTIWHDQRLRFVLAFCIIIQNHQVIIKADI